MTNLDVRDQALLDPEGGLAALRGDCARMAPHWVTAAPAAPAAPRHVPPSSLHGVVVPPGSARLLDAMSDYGD